MPRRKKTQKKLRGRERRLHMAPEWVASRGDWNPRNLLKRYRKYFCVDWECAIVELEALGVRFDPEYLSRLREAIGRDFSDEKRKTPIGRWEFDVDHDMDPESDETFAFIAGYTSGGFPYGITWEEQEAMRLEEEEEAYNLSVAEESDLPVVFEE
jgi:hypothetical protein